MLVMLCPYFILAQHKALQPGDTIPQQVFAEFSQSFETGNRQRETIFRQASDIQSGSIKTPILLNFMSIGCISCLHALSKIDSLQQRYGFLVLLVTPDTKEKVAAFLKRRSLPFPIIAEDTLLKSFFPHAFISHIVWIRNNRVNAITGTEYITTTNIETFVEGRQLSLPLKKDLVEYDYSISLLPPAQDPSAFYSVLLPNKSGVPRRLLQGIDSSKAIRWLRIINYPLVDMYCKAYRLPLRLPKKQLQLMVADSARFIFNKQKHFRQQWNSENTYCYEACFPLAFTEQECLQFIRRDLDKRLRLRTWLEQKFKPVLVITEQAMHKDL
ncbi:MAG TPA: hypothetical protein VF476_00350 [Chitinophagaceae bacterium]